MGLLREGEKRVHGEQKARGCSAVCCYKDTTQNYSVGSVKPSHSATSLGFNHKSKNSRSVGFFSQLNKWCRSYGPRPQSGQLSFTSGEIRLLYELRRVEYPVLS